MLIHLLRTLLKRIVFRKRQMALEIIIVVVYTIALSFIPHSIAENTEQVDWLYGSTEVLGTIVRDPMVGERFAEVGITTQVIEDIAELINDDNIPLISSYFATTLYFMSILSSNLSDDELQITIDNFKDERLRMSNVRAFNQKERYESFFSRQITVEYFESFDDDFFAQTNSDVSAIIISREYMEQEGMMLGDYVNIFPISFGWCFEEMQSFPEIQRGRYHTYKIVGVYERPFDGTHGYTSLEAMQRHESSRHLSDFLIYWPFEFILNTELNREIELSRDKIIDRIIHYGLPFILIIHDDTLREVIMPLERNIAMMSNLYLLYWDYQCLLP